MLSTTTHLILTPGSPPPSIRTLPRGDGRTHATITHGSDMEGGTGSVSWLHLPDALAHCLHILSELAPDLNHAGLVDFRNSVDALASRCGELMALLEFEDEANARSVGADEVMA